MPSAVRTGQVGCTGPVKRGKKHISISLKIDDAQYSWITCPEVSVCQCLCCHWKMSRWLSLTMAMNFRVCRQVRCIWLCVALRHLSFSGKLLCWNSFLKTVFGWAANSRKRASDNALHSRVLAFTSKGEAIRRGPELKNTVVCHPSALHQNEGWPPSFVRGSLHASVTIHGSWHKIEWRTCPQELLLNQRTEWFTVNSLDRRLQDLVHFGHSLLGQLWWFLCSPCWLQRSLAAEGTSRSDPSLSSIVLGNFQECLSLAHICHLVLFMGFAFQRPVVLCKEPLKSVLQSL